MNLKEKLKQNKKNGQATLATNFYNFETLSAVLTAAKNENSSLILQLSESSIKYLGLSTAISMCRSLQKEYEVESWLHLDHGSDMNLIKKSIDLGFDSVMIDASEKSMDENIALTKEIVRYAESYNINVEGELGYVAKLGQSQSQLVFTQPEEAKYFVEMTGVDALAVAVGSAHGFYSQTPTLQIDLINKINKITDASLVLHGGSGIPHDQILSAIQNGMTKINLATEIKNSFMLKLREVLGHNNEIDLRKVFPKATNAAVELVTEKLQLINYS
ncbi:MAG: ketose-bisphosphate aldolase [Lutibacter sp.]|uniref:class II fructose-bisphosphate aldolase n=1 Tax=Lutibacter sp. TaxID=1925666 RepID=UPI0019D84E82|nr:class II fructose-bisphosphate aldolase [Lutibacter sp.]NOR26963.1 ketose-bisphosphate aldolase [Lutibacter sp.]